MKRYGWRCDSLDARDYRFAPTRAAIRRLPAVVDNGKYLAGIFDQGNVGSCVGCSCDKAFEFIAKKQGKPFTGSPLFAYWNARTYIGSTDWDSGAEIRDGIKGLNQFGLSSLKAWPYRTSKVTTAPTAKAFREGEKHQTLRYERIDNSRLNDIKAAIAAGNPVVFGFTVYESFENIGPSGKMPMPKANEVPLGGHAVYAIGYSDKTDRLMVANSWGSSWGKRGLFTMPYEFATDTNYCDDWWSIGAVE